VSLKKTKEKETKTRKLSSPECKSWSNCNLQISVCVEGGKANEKQRIQRKSLEAR